MEQNAMTLVQENNKLQAQLSAILKKDVARLGDGNVFFLEEAGQTKRAFKVRVDLEYPHQFCFPAGADAKSMITAEGYDKLNQYAGIEVFRPKTVIAQDGAERGNPYFERDPKTGAMLSVFMRGIGIGYAPTGNLTAVDQTVYVNLQTLLVQEVQAKIKKYPALGMLGSADQRPTEITYYGDNGQKGFKRVVNETPTVQKCVGAWHFIPLASGMGYWVNISHPEIQAAFDSFTQKQRFLERTTFSILKRLIISSHPAVAAKTPVVTDLQKGEYNKITSAKAHVVIFGFKADSRDAQKKREELEAMATRVADGERMANMEVVVNTGHDAAEEAEIAQPEMVADPTEMPPAPEPEPGEEPAPANPTTTTNDTCKSSLNGCEKSQTAVSSATVANDAQGSINAGDPLAEVASLFKDKSNGPVAQKVRNEMGQKDWNSIKTDAAIAADFMARFKQAKGVAA